MIYTVTFNPSLDYIVFIDQFIRGKVNRSAKEFISCGGKGINVSIVLQHLGVENIALGFVAGNIGTFIQEEMQRAGCRTEFIQLKKGCSRINVKLKENLETEINGNGPVIDEIDLKRLFHKLDVLKKGDILVLAGKAADSVPDTIYGTMVRRAHEKGAKTIVDASDELLRLALGEKPFLVKPNQEELEELYQAPNSNKEQLVCLAKRMQDDGARNVLISRGRKGALLLTEEGEILECLAPKGQAVNSTGAGDSMVAGFIWGYGKNRNMRDALQMSVAAGSASTFSEKLADMEEVKQVLKSMDI